MKLITIAMLVLLGCQPSTSDYVEDYINESCVGGEPDEVWYIHRSCHQDWVVLGILDSVDYVNEALDVEIQICGYEWNPPGNYIHCDLAPETGDGWESVGWTNGRVIKLWPLRMLSLMHFDKVVRHEFGHVLAGHYRHSKNPDDLMCQGWHRVTEFTDNDIKLIKGE